MKRIFAILLIFLFAFPSMEANTSMTFVETLEKVEKIVVSFTLRNSSLKSIPLKIPGVMNPNLSPDSNSVVSLKIGQKNILSTQGSVKKL